MPSAADHTATARGGVPSRQRSRAARTNTGRAGGLLLRHRTSPRRSRGRAGSAVRRASGRSDRRAGSARPRTESARRPRDEATTPTARAARTTRRSSRRSARSARSSPMTSGVGGVEPRERPLVALGLQCLDRVLERLGRDGSSHDVGRDESIDELAQHHRGGHLGDDLVRGERSRLARKHGTDATLRERQGRRVAGQAGGDLVEGGLRGPPVTRRPLLGRRAGRDRCRQRRRRRTSPTSRSPAERHSCTSSMSVPNAPFGWTNATVVPREPGRGASSMTLPPASFTACSATAQSATR